MLGKKYINDSVTPRVRGGDGFSFTVLCQARETGDNSCQNAKTKEMSVTLS